MEGRARSLFQKLDPSGQQQALWGWLDQGGDDEPLLWSLCPRGDWLAWWMVHAGVDLPLVVQACCECVRMAEVCLPVCEDAPRRVILAASAWAEHDATPEPCRQAILDASELASGASLRGAGRAAALGSVWLGRLVVRSQQIADGGVVSGLIDEAATDAYLATWHAAASIASDATLDEENGGDWWGRCLLAALGRFAEVIRGCVLLEQFQQGSPRVAPAAVSAPWPPLPSPARSPG